ncbi:MAG TPA: D-glycero-beta-D-manno-heptose-7-phosphate kinase [Desulfomicrobiaceae bacterium]|nr:D-glycero-beta-D-manno-heptose-7-phosphate kinase [Desulfomicrobiaceae bacterium]
MRSRQELFQAVQGLASGRVLIIGDTMLDRYQWGTVDRISPEAPVPVVTVNEETLKLGGAGNVARNIRHLGGTPSLISVRGEDIHGRKLEELLDSWGIEHSLVASKSRPTTVKTRVIAGNQQIVRIDEESSSPLTGPCRDRIIACLQEKISAYPVIILSDYGKGVICGELLEWVREHTRKDQLVLVDPKTRNFSLYTDLSLMTPNAKEASEGAGMAISDPKETVLAGNAIMARNHLDNLLITLGARGMALFRRDHPPVFIPTAARRVFDVTGAGDTVIAVIGLALSAGHDIVTACILANHAAGIVVGQVGTAAVAHAELLEAVTSEEHPEMTEWADHPVQLSPQQAPPKPE